MKSDWIYIKVVERPDSTPTERAVIRLFCYESFAKNGEVYWDRVIHKNALPYTHKHIKAERLWRKIYYEKN